MNSKVFYKTIAVKSCECGKEKKAIYVTKPSLEEIFGEREKETTFLLGRKTERKG